MPQTCSVCRSSQRQQIDRALLKGTSLRIVARRYGVSKDAAARHARHVTTMLARSPEKAEIAGEALRGRFIRTTEGLIDELLRLRRKAEMSHDIRGAGKLIESTFKGLELLAKFWGLMNERTQHNELHLHLTPEQALRVAETYAARHRGRVLEAGPEGNTADRASAAPAEADATDSESKG